MNYAQLIDPEWAQAGYPERHPARRRAVPEFDLRVVTKCERQEPKAPQWGRRTGQTKRICALLATQEAPRTAVQIEAIDPTMPARAVSTAMKPLVESGRVRRSGPWGAYAYSLTAKGRAWLKGAKWV